MLLDKIQDLLAFGIGVKFEREINQFKITLSKEREKSQLVVLPFDHLNEERVCDYINLMQEKFNTKKTKTDKGGKEEKD